MKAAVSDLPQNGGSPLVMVNNFTGETSRFSRICSEFRQSSIDGLPMLAQKYPFGF